MQRRGRQIADTMACAIGLAVGLMRRLRNLSTGSASPASRVIERLIRVVE